MSTSLVASSTRLPTEAVTSPSRGQPTLVKTGGLPPCRGRSCPDSAGGSLPPGCGVLPLVALGTSPQQGRRRQVAVVPAADPLPGRPGRSRPDFQGCAGCLQDDPSGVVHGIAIATPRLRQPREATTCTRTRPGRTAGVSPRRCRCAGPSSAKASSTPAHRMSAALFADLSWLAGRRVVVVTPLPRGRHDREGVGALDDGDAVGVLPGDVGDADRPGAKADGSGAHGLLVADHAGVIGGSEWGRRRRRRRTWSPTI
jgi:hypothetical protein